MIQSKYLFACLFFLFLFSCEKEEFVADVGGKKNEYYINPEDTAGIAVAEGYTLVYFPPDKAMTRAGSETRIKHLQYIIYQEDKDAAGNYVFYKRVPVNRDFTSWPIRGITTTVPRGYAYKVVFLGNVDKSVFGSNQTKEVLTGVGDNLNFIEARIKLPDVEFSSSNLYYWAQNKFIASNDQTVKVSYVPITLKRIVSRTDITREGLSPEYITGDVNKDTYKSVYWKKLIKEKLIEDIFLNENSTFKYQVAEGMKKNLIYPLIYFGLANPNDAATQQNNYTSIKAYNKEWNNYKPTNETTLKSIDDFRVNYVNSGYITNNYANNLFIRYAQYLYEIFYESKDNTVLKSMLAQIYNDNKKDKNTHPTIDAAIDKIVTAFNDNYISGILLPWRNSKYYDAVITTSTLMPGGVDLDLKVDESLSIGTGQKCYKLQNSADYSIDNYISIITLGEPETSANKLGISGISLASTGGSTIYDIPTANYIIKNSLFGAGSFHRNRKTVATQIIESVNLTNPNLILTADKYRQPVEVSIYNLFYTQMKAQKINGDIQVGDIAVTTSLSPADLHLVQTTLLNILTSKYYGNEFTYGDVPTMSYPFVIFMSPDVSPTNIADDTVTTNWLTEEVE